MARKEGSSNPLALAVLVLLGERAMHPYEIAATLKMRYTHGSIKIRYGSLYTVIESLERDGLVVVKEIVREGAGPSARCTRSRQPAGSACKAGCAS